MPSGPISHADRSALTLANFDAVRAGRETGDIALPGPGSRDCRMDLKLLQWQAKRASEQSAAARQHLAELPAEARPDLWAGTVQDGTARGFAARLEEAVSLAPPPPAVPAPQFEDDPARSRLLVGRQLRGRKDILVESGGARVRFTRREGVLFVDRDERVHSSDCLRFDARTDRGTLDEFVGDEAERPRIYSARFLQPQRYFTAPDYARLELAGRIGRGPVGWDMSLSFTGRRSEPFVRVEIELDNQMRDRRLRVRFLGMPSALVRHECTDVREVVANDRGGFVAFTLVRSCGTLLVDGAPVATPAARCLGTLRHRFALGTPT